MNIEGSCLESNGRKSNKRAYEVFKEEEVEKVVGKETEGEFIRDSKEDVDERLCQ